MSIGNLDLDPTDGLALEEWLKSDKAKTLQRDLEERIMRFLFSMDPDSFEFRQTVERLAWIGSRNKTLLGRDIAQLRRSLESVELTPCGLKAIWNGASKVAHFIADHRTEIFVGAALCATGLGIAAALGYSLTVSVSGIAIAGAGSIFQQAEEPNPHIPRNAPPPPPLAQSYPVPQLELPPTDLLVTADGISSNGQFYSNTELMQSSLFAEELAQHPETKWNFYPPSSPPLPTGEIPLASSVPSTYEIPSRPTKNPPPPRHEPHPFRNEAPTPISRHFTIPGKPNAHIGWINGVDNTFEESRASGTYIQHLAGGHAISGIYNHTHTIFVDLTEAALLNHNGHSPITAPLLQAQWTAFHTANADRPNLKFLQICHSQGAIHVRNALEGISPEIGDRVMVVAVAPGAIVPRRLCYKSFNYASEKDIVYKFEPSPPRPVESITLDDVLLPTYGEAAADDRAELIILQAHADAKGIDHEIQSLTFRPYLKEILEDYENHNGEYLPEEKGQ